jgi:phosphoribosylanthranilate isomerase
MPAFAYSALSVGRHSGGRCAPRMLTCAVRMSVDTVKVCGVVSPSDASMIARVFREEMPGTTKLMLGMIIWPGSKRSVDRLTARGIVKVAVDSGATPVGVFVDETTDEIVSACSAVGLSIAQLHGPACRAAVRDKPLPLSIGVVDVIDVLPDGSLANEACEHKLEALWTLYDAKGGGTGRTFDWQSFPVPSGNWFLAGGLAPENVGDAVRILQPFGLDVASGVADADGCSKSEKRLREFVRQVSAAGCSLE